jgi:hypothetical protein
MNQIPITVKNKKVSRTPTSSSGLFVLGKFAMFACLLVYGVCEFRIQMMSSETKKLQTDMALLSRKSTNLQTDIYKETSSSDFLAKASQERNIRFNEPKDITIQYMRLPDTTFVMR